MIQVYISYLSYNCYNNCVYRDDTSSYFLPYNCYNNCVYRDDTILYFLPYNCYNNCVYRNDTLYKLILTLNPKKYKFLLISSNRRVVLIEENILRGNCNYQKDIFHILGYSIILCIFSLKSTFEGVSKYPHQFGFHIFLTRYISIVSYLPT